MCFYILFWLAKLIKRILLFSLFLFPLSGCYNNSHIRTSKILEDKHFNGKTRKDKRKTQEGVYQRYYSGQITKKQFVKSVDGRSPVELLETNIISQQEYDEAIANPLNYLEYIEMFGPSITLKRKPAYLIIPGFVVYVVSYIIFAS